MRILLATDGSEYSELAARFVLCLNLSPDDEITVFHVIFWYPLYYETGYYNETLKEIKQEIAPKILDRTLDILRPLRAKLSTAIEDGFPEQCVVNAAASHDFDLIVMGARGIKGITSLFIGSVTRSVAANSARPILIIKPPGCGAVGRPLKLLFATDGSAHSADTMGLLSKIPFPDSTEVTILNVISTPFLLSIPETYYPVINERVLEIEDKAREMEFRNSGRIIDTARGCLVKRFNKINVLSEVGDPSAEILRVSEEAGSDIIAMGCRGLKGLKGIMGSVSRNVITHSRCSVLIGKMCKE